MKRINFALMHLFFLTALAVYPSTSLKNLTIYQDCNLFDSVGFDDCKMHSNGEYLIIQHLIQDNDIVFDVGANKGDWSRHIYTTKKSVQLYAFEPIPAIFKKLQSNLSHITNFCYNIALSNHPGTQDFFYYNINPGASEVSGLFHRPIVDKILNAKATIIKVETNTLDSFCSQHVISKIDFLKIDTEGAELHVLEGAKNLLKTNAIKILQFEYGGTYTDARITLKQVYDLLTSYNYRVFRIIPQGLVEITEWRTTLENYKYSNYIAIS